MHKPILDSVGEAVQEVGLTNENMQALFTPTA